MAPTWTVECIRQVINGWNIIKFSCYLYPSFFSALIIILEERNRLSGRLTDIGENFAKNILSIKIQTRSKTIILSFQVRIGTTENTGFYYSVLDWSSVESRFNLLAVGATNVRPVATKTMMNAVKMIRRTEVWNKLLLQRNERTRMDNAARVRNRCPARNLKI